MGTSSVSGMFDVLITAFGGYILYTWFQMKRTREVRGGMFLPQGIDPEKCLDKEGYINHIGPRLLLIGIVCLLSGLLGLAVDYMGILSETAYFVITLLVLAILIWYGISVRKAVEKFWEGKK